MKLINRGQFPTKFWMPYLQRMLSKSHQRNLNASSCFEFIHLKPSPFKVTVIELGCHVRRRNDSLVYSSWSMEDDMKIYCYPKVLPRSYQGHKNLSASQTSSSVWSLPSFLPLSFMYTFFSHHHFHIIHTSHAFFLQLHFLHFSIKIWLQRGKPWSLSSSS